MLREYIWPGWEPIAVVQGGAVQFVRADHIYRPVFATNGAGAVVWAQSYDPFGRVVSGAGSDARFAGQWFAAENGLHQNWMRDYDASLGRYIQADPLGLVDGASVYGYTLQNPARWSDPRGEFVVPPVTIPLSVPQPPGVEGLQCAGFANESCHDRYDKETDLCFARYGMMMIANKRACLDRAANRFRLCFNGVPKADWPPEWSDADEVGRMSTAPIPMPQPPPLERLLPWLGVIAITVGGLVWSL